MDTIGEVAVRIAGAILRVVAEALLELIFEPVFRIIGRAYGYLLRHVRRIVHSDLLATPVTVLLLFAVGAGILVAIIKTVQALIA
jgi:hypothetical protein